LNPVARLVPVGGFKVAIYAIIPVKKLADSKKRLSTVFTPQQRTMLTLAMLEDVLKTLKASIVHKIIVVGEDPQVQETAEQFGAFYRFANGATLNSAIEETTSYCVKKGAQSILVLPADVPLINSEEINRIIQLADDGTSAIVLSPSHDWGTNALYQSPPKLIPACFGPNSFIRHIREALRNGVSVRLHFSLQLAADIDSAEDLKKIFEIKNTTISKRFLERIDFNRKIL
jgi:2-phospho-L-lactate guanylyltransferase